MSTTLQSIIEEFSAEDQKLIRSKASVLAEEMVRHADSLAAVRTALVKTQDEVSCARVRRGSQVGGSSCQQVQAEGQA